MKLPGSRSDNLYIFGVLSWGIASEADRLCCEDATEGSRCFPAVTYVFSVTNNLITLIFTKLHNPGLREMPCLVRIGFDTIFPGDDAIFRLTATTRNRYDISYAIVMGRLGRNQGRCSET